MVGVWRGQCGIGVLRAWGGCVGAVWVVLGMDDNGYVGVGWEWFVRGLACVGRVWGVWRVSRGLSFRRCGVTD